MSGLGHSGHPPWTCHVEQVPGSFPSANYRNFFVSCRSETGGPALVPSGAQVSRAGPCTMRDGKKDGAVGPNRSPDGSR